MTAQERRCLDLIRNGAICCLKGSRTSAFIANKPMFYLSQNKRETVRYPTVPKRVLTGLVDRVILRLVERDVTFYTFEQKPYEISMLVYELCETASKHAAP